MIRDSQYTAAADCCCCCCAAAAATAAAAAAAPHVLSRRRRRCARVPLCSRLGCQLNKWFIAYCLCQGMDMQQGIENSGSARSRSRSRSRSRNSSSSEDTLKCSICMHMVVSAVQPPCCGNPYCRRCITTWLASNETCPCCRAQLRSDAIVPDYRTERLSLAALRPCVYSIFGCRFEGNRADITEHELICAFVHLHLNTRGKGTFPNYCGSLKTF